MFFSHVCTKMCVYLGIIFIILAEVKFDVTATCGALEFEQAIIAEDCPARLVYSPIEIFAIRRWYKEIPASSPIKICDREKCANATKYIESNDGNKFILLFKSVEQRDAGKYIVSCGGPYFHTSRANLKVLDRNAPTPPKFLGVEDIPGCTGCIPAELNVAATVSCSINGGSDAFMSKDGKMINDVQRVVRSKCPRLETLLLYQFKPTMDNFDTNFTCTVKTPASNGELAQSAKIYVKADPQTIDIKLKSVTEYESSDIQCITTRGRPPLKSLIYIGGNLEDDVQVTEEVRTGNSYNITTSHVKVFTRFDNQKEVYCCSDILTRFCSSTANVNVKFPPRSVSVTEVKKDNKENGDTELTLKCSVDESNPKSRVEWEGINSLPENFVDETFSNLTKSNGWTFSTTWAFNLTKEDNNREIRCKVSNPEFPDIMLLKIYRPNITYAPVITISGHKTAYVGEDVILTCHVDSNPPSVIKWYNETDQVEESYGAKSLNLHLSDISLGHSQMYTCTARNNIGGTKTSAITLIVKDALETLYSQRSGILTSPSVAGPIAGGAVVMIVAIVAVTVFLIRRQRGQNAAPQRQRTHQNRMEQRKQGVHPTENDMQRKGNRDETIKTLESEHDDCATPDYEEVAETELVHKISEDSTVMKPENPYYNDRLGRGRESDSQCYYNVNQEQVTVAYEKLDESKMETETYTQI